MNDNQREIYSDAEYGYRNNSKSQDNTYKVIIIVTVCILAVALIAVAGVFIFLQNSQSSKTTMYVSSAEAVYLRRTPSADDGNNIICPVPHGSAVSFVENAAGNFAKVFYADQYGYIKADKLSLTVPVIDSPDKEDSSSGDNTKQDYTVKKYMYVANVKNSIYLRSSASEADSSNIICTIPWGTSVGFIERANSVFSKISYGSYVGYAKTQYLSDTDPSAYYYSNETVSKNVYIANVKHSVFFRSTPSEASQSNVICEIPLHTQVGFIEYSDSTFSKVLYGSKVGFVKTKYLSDYNTSYYNSPVYMTVCNVKHSIYLRSTASSANNSNIICEIPVNSTVELLERTNSTFYKIRWKGMVGYSKASYLR